MSLDILEYDDNFQLLRDLKWISRPEPKLSILHFKYLSVI